MDGHLGRYLLPYSGNFSTTLGTTTVFDYILFDIKTEPVDEKFPTSMTERLLAFISR